MMPDLGAVGEYKGVGHRPNRGGPREAQQKIWNLAQSVVYMGTWEVRGKPC